MCELNLFFRKVRHVFFCVCLHSKHSKRFQEREVLIFDFKCFVNVCPQSFYQDSESIIQLPANRETLQIGTNRKTIYVNRDTP